MALPIGVGALENDSSGNYNTAVGRSLPFFFITEGN